MIFSWQRFTNKTVKNQMMFFFGLKIGKHLAVFGHLHFLRALFISLAFLFTSSSLPLVLLLFSTSPVFLPTSGDCCLATLGPGMGLCQNRTVTGPALRVPCRREAEPASLELLLGVHALMPQRCGQQRTCLPCLRSTSPIYMHVKGVDIQA